MTGHGLASCRNRDVLHTPATASKCAQQRRCLVSAGKIPQPTAVGQFDRKTPQDLGPLACASRLAKLGSLCQVQCKTIWICLALSQTAPGNAAGFELAANGSLLRRLASCQGRKGESEGIFRNFGRHHNHSGLVTSLPARLFEETMRLVF